MNTDAHRLHSLCTAVTLDEARERTSVSWMHNPCLRHVEMEWIVPIFGDPPLIGQCFIRIIYDK